MKKGSTYTLVFLLSILIVLLTVTLFMGIKDKNFGRKKVSLQLSESYELASINNINIETKSADIYFKKSDDEKVYVDIYAAESEKVLSTVEDEKLNIELKTKTNFCFFCVGNGYQRRIEIKLPESFDGKININTKSGDVEMGSYTDAKLNLSARSGDVTIKEIKTADINLTSGDIEISKIKTANIKATSGDIKLGKVNKMVDIKVTSGDIRINNFVINADSIIKATSGDIRIKKLSDAFVETSVKSGDVHVNGSNRNAQYELSIKVTSGDIRVN